MTPRFVYRAVPYLACLVAAAASGGAVARPMNEALRHRGPDDEGIWTDRDAWCERWG